jgi:hypothetical protein
MGELSFSYAEALQKPGSLVEQIAQSTSDQRSSFLRCEMMHVYEIKPRKDALNFARITSPLPLKPIWNDQKCHRQSMKPTAPLRNGLNVVAPAPCRGLSRFR